MPVHVQDYGFPMTASVARDLFRAVVTFRATYSEKLEQGEEERMRFGSCSTRLFANRSRSVVQPALRSSSSSAYRPRPARVARSSAGLDVSVPDPREKRGAALRTRIRRCDPCVEVLRGLAADARDRLSLQVVRGRELLVVGLPLDR